MKHGSVTHSDIIEVRPTYLKRDERWFYCVALDVLFDFLRLILPSFYVRDRPSLAGRWPSAGTSRSDTVGLRDSSTAVCAASS